MSPWECYLLRTLLGPIFWLQGKRVRRVTPRLPEPPGPRAGILEAKLTSQTASPKRLINLDFLASKLIRILPAPWSNRDRFQEVSMFRGLVTRLSPALSNKKACYRLSSRLFNAHKAYLVGCAGVEPTTNGLKVRCSTN